MSTAVKSVKPITLSALALSPKSRAKLAETLLASLDKPGHEEIDRSWAKEAEDRIRAFDASEMDCVSGKEVFRQLKSRKRA
jgi:putative addiction module component (TIGR02574 family)